MSYTADTISPRADAERKLLLDGFTYKEIAEAHGTRHKSIAERNRLIYKVDLKEAFARRIEREGVPCRLNIADAFGYWFSGFFDGEGHLGAFSRLMPNGYTERRLTIQIMLRDDDASIIDYIKENLGGNVHRSATTDTANGKIAWRIERVQDLAEIVLPLFTKFPLHSKKGREFEIWKTMVLNQYSYTLGGYSQRAACTSQEIEAFESGLQAIQAIRNYKRV